MFFSEHGVMLNSINLLNQEPVDVDEEIAEFRTWYRWYGKGFIAGKKVPPPKLSMVFYHDP